MIKKILGLVITSALLFSLVACNTGNLGEYKAAGKAQIDARVATLMQTDYTVSNWQDILQISADGKLKVEAAESKAAVNTAVMATKAEINAVLKEYEMAFVLTISVDNAIVTHGQKIIANAVLKNKTDESYNIAIFRFVGWVIPEWYYSEIVYDAMPSEPSFHLLKKGDNHIASHTLWVESEQNLGVFELQATAAFYLNFGQPNEEKIVVKSNEINITVQ